MRIVSDVRSGRRTVMPAAKWRRAATAGLAAATLMASGPVAAEDFYLRTGIGLDRSAETRFTDTDCASLSPAALYGCGPGPDGAPRSSLGDFGTRTGLGLGIGYAAAFSTRFEVLMEDHPRFAFEGHANFLESTRQQSVSAALSSLSGLLTAYVDLPRLGLPRLGPFSPFIGSGVGVARLELDDTRMTFPKTTTLVPGARRVNLAWILMTGGRDIAQRGGHARSRLALYGSRRCRDRPSQGPGRLARREQRTAGTRSRRHAGKADEPRASAFPALRLLRLEPRASEQMQEETIKAA